MVSWDDLSKTQKGIGAALALIGIGVVGERMLHDHLSVAPEFDAFQTDEEVFRSEMREQTSVLKKDVEANREYRIRDTCRQLLIVELGRDRALEHCFLRDIEHVEETLRQRGFARLAAPTDTT